MDVRIGAGSNPHFDPCKIECLKHRSALQNRTQSALQGRTQSEQARAKPPRAILVESHPLPF